MTRGRFHEFHAFVMTTNQVFTIVEVAQVHDGILTDGQRMRPKKSEVERLCASNDKARKLLGWQRKYGGLVGFRRGLAETVACFSKLAKLSDHKPEIYNI